MGIWLVRLFQNLNQSTDLTWRINYIQCYVPLILKLNIMDRVKAQEILKAYGRPSLKVGKTNLVFARQTEESLSEIESKTNEELIEHWKSLVWMNEIYGQVSLNEMQRISLIELEMDCRKIETAPLKSWYETESAKFDEQDFNGA
mgnify:FL=1|jgi:hypothetical protein